MMSSFCYFFVCVCVCVCVLFFVMVIDVIVICDLWVCLYHADAGDVSYDRYGPVREGDGS